MARDLLAMAEAGPLSDFQQANADLMRAQLALITSRGGDAPALLLKAARRLEPIDPDLSRATFSRTQLDRVLPSDTAIGQHPR